MARGAEHGHSIAPRDLMARHVDTLFRCDEQGRLRHVNELEAPAAPRFYLGRTTQGNVWRMRHDLPASLADHLDRLCRAEPVNSDLTGPPHHAAEIRQALHAHGTLAREYSGPAYWIEQESPVPAHVTLISQANTDLLRDRFDWMATLLHQVDPAQIGPVAAAVVDDRAVALCFCSRLPGEATEAGVETLSAWRGQGHATAAVAGWAAAVRNTGTIPLYSTTWDNLASQRIAHKLNMQRYGVDWWVK